MQREIIMPEPVDIKSNTLGVGVKPIPADPSSIPAFDVTHYYIWDKELTAIEQKILKGNPRDLKELKIHGDNIDQVMADYRKSKQNYIERHKKLLQQLEEEKNNLTYKDDIQRIKTQIDEQHKLLVAKDRTLNQRIRKKHNNIASILEEKALDHLALRVTKHIESLKSDTCEEKREEQTGAPDDKLISHFEDCLSRIPSYPQNQNKRTYVNELIDKAQENLKAKKDLHELEVAIKQRENSSEETLSSLITWYIDNDQKEISHVDYIMAKGLQERWDTLKVRFERSSRTRAIDQNITKLKVDHFTAKKILGDLSCPGFPNDFLYGELQNRQITLTSDLMLAMLRYIGKNNFSEDPKQNLQAKKTRAMALFKQLIPQMEMNDVLELGKKLIDNKENENYSYIRQERGWRRFFWKHGDTHTWKELMTLIQCRVVYLNTYDRDYVPNPSAMGGVRKAIPINNHHNEDVNKKNYDAYCNIMHEKTSFFTCLSIFPPNRKPRQADGELDNKYNPSL